jgi:hypothetical protein
VLSQEKYRHIRNRGPRGHGLIQVPGLTAGRTAKLPESNNIFKSLFLEMQLWA